MYYSATGLNVRTVWPESGSVWCPIAGMATRSLVPWSRSLGDAITYLINISVEVHGGVLFPRLPRPSFARHPPAVPERSELR